MMNRPIEGVVIAGTRKGAAFGQSVFRDVVLRRRDGVEQKLGGVMVASSLDHALVPGAEGRFFLHEMMGSQGLHGFEPAGGTTQLAFPKLVERVFAVLAFINLALCGAWISATGDLQLVPLMVGVLATTGWATCRGCREAVLHDFRFEDRVAAARTHRQAVLRGHG
jgi:hypothetical protein